MAAQNPALFGLGVRGRSAAVTAQERVNCYLDIEPLADKAQVTLYGLPGVEEFANLGAGPLRALESVPPYLYAVSGNRFYQIRNDGVAVEKGTLDTDEQQVYAPNNADYLLLVDGLGGYTYRPSTDVFADVTDADFPSTPTSAEYAQGYFLVTQGATEEFHVSALDDPTSWPGDFDLAYTDPDALVRVAWVNGVVLMLGGRSVEPWHYTGEADFPFGRVLASQYHWGLAARGSLAVSDAGAYALMRRREGGLGVCRLTGAPPELVSPPDVCALLDAYEREGRVDDAVGASFSIAGHPLYQLSLPTAGVTWVFSGRTGAWQRRRTYGLEHHLGRLGVQHQGAIYWADYADGRIWKQSAPGVHGNGRLDWSGVVWTDGQDDDGNDRPVVLDAVSEHVHLPGGLAFTVDSLELGMEAGLGTQTGQGSDPQVLLQVSRDGGHSWGPLRMASAGKAGQHGRRVRWVRPTGQCRDAVFRVRISDPLTNRVITHEVLRLRAARH